MRSHRGAWTSGKTSAARPVALPRPGGKARRSGAAGRPVLFPAAPSPPTAAMGDRRRPGSSDVWPIPRRQNASTPAGTLSNAGRYVRGRSPEPVEAIRRCSIWQVLGKRAAHEEQGASRRSGRGLIVSTRQVTIRRLRALGRRWVRHVIVNGTFVIRDANWSGPHQARSATRSDGAKNDLRRSSPSPAILWAPGLWESIPCSLFSYPPRRSSPCFRFAALWKPAVLTIFALAAFPRSKDDRPARLGARTG